jgi:hypothetical protein
MISEEDVRKLKYHAMDFAMMMDDEDIEKVIFEFIEVKRIRDNYRRER